jgi:SagB-type dehydrogenase family enzyme
VHLRRARTVLIYWQEGKLVFENYRTQTSITADPRTAQILHFFDQWRQPGELCGQIPQYFRGSVRAAVRQLLRHTLLVRKGTPEARQDAQLAKTWWAWLPYGALHFATKDVHFVGPRRQATLLRRYLAESRQPLLFKSYRHAPRLLLPPQSPAEGEFLGVLTARKTHREFSPVGLPLDAISDLLFYTWGVSGFVHSPILGRLPHKTSPSGGARHPGEVYLIALRVKGLAPGLYHYDPQHHRLEELRRGGMAEKAVRYCGGQRWVKSAAALFLMTAVFRRVMWKYRVARAYRVVLADAGHLCQTFCLVATWLGLAPFCVMALKDSLIEKDLGLDGISESVLYAAGVGVPRGGASPRGTLRRRLFASL